MNLQEALKILKIEKYEERIFNSNSHGELFHIQQYFSLAEAFKDAPPEEIERFSKWFDETVKFAEEYWARPESVFQHIIKVMTGK